MGVSQREKGYQKYAWILAVLGGVIWLLFGFVLLLPGNALLFTGNPSTYSQQAANDLTAGGRIIGVFLVAGGLFQIAVGTKAFRRGEKWAWYAFLSLPFIGVLNSYMDYAGQYYAGGPAPYVFTSYIVFFTPQLVALLLPIRKFFPKKQPG